MSFIEFLEVEQEKKTCLMMIILSRIENWYYHNYKAMVKPLKK